MTFIDYTKDYQHCLENLMAAYMAELGDDTPEDVVRRKLFPFIHKQFDAKLIRITLALEGGTPIGFSVYQIDIPESDWCKRPGWGFIREFYIAPEFRRRNAGRRLADDTEQRLRNMGCTQLYLTSDTAVPFWERCGYTNTNEQCSNGSNILIK